MVATNLKGETMKLMEKRTAVESEMNAIIESLTLPGGPGLSGNLVDAEGFPRSDIDIPAVRAERHRLSELRNDHQRITAKIDENIQILHSARLAPKTSVAQDSGDGSGLDNEAPLTVNPAASASSRDVPSMISSGDMDVDVIVNRPFAIVDEIADNSPAVEDGLQLGDQIVKFGDVEAGDTLLQRLASVAQTNQGRGVAVIATRQGVAINLTVTPRTWSGRGLLGCHFRLL